mmetsp:Transcript_13280/g.28130  ORF Transcript_13280/g.28130 Transcript_13280/m.28130 type:complete len:206 (-) Transcript_13280:115-732(-)
MYPLSFILLAATLVAVSAMVHRGSSSTSVTTEEQTRYHRHLFKQVTCKLYLQTVAYGPTSEEPYGHSGEEWGCELPSDISSELGLFFVDINALSDAVIAKTTSGVSTLTVAEAIVDIRERRMYIPDYSSAKIQTDFSKDNRSRKLASGVGTPDTLMIRVIDANDARPNSNQIQLRNYYGHPSSKDALCITKKPSNGDNFITQRLI